MPQASEEDRAWARETFGSIEPNGPEEYLKKRGWQLQPDYLWLRPNESHDPTAEENACILFLVYEWDYGGWVERPATA